MSYTQYHIATVTLNTIFAVAGTFINVWFLAAILQSPEIRSRMRSKIMCGMLVANLIETMIFCPTAISSVDMIWHYPYYFDCFLSAVYINLYHIQDFVGNWYIFISICVYAAQVMNFQPKFNPQWMQIVTAVIIVSPLIFALLFVPLTMNRFSDDGCLFTTDESIKVFKSVDMIVPHSLASLLLVVTAVFKYRRYPQERSSDTLPAQLMDDRSQIDPVYPFIALLVTAVVSDLCLVLAIMNPTLFGRLKFETWTYLWLTFEAITYLRLILVPVMLLLFPDIRERIKTWRPCRRSAPPADLDVPVRHIQYNSQRPLEVAEIVD